MYITIDGETHEIDKVLDYGHLPLLVIGNQEYYVAESSEKAGVTARDYWEEMADNDTREFTCIVGEKTLVAWALGQWAGPGSTSVNSLSDWLDLWLDTPEEHFAGYDGEECEARGPSYELLAELGFDYDQEQGWVAYRHN